MHRPGCGGKTQPGKLELRRQPVRTDASHGPYHKHASLCTELPCYYTVSRNTVFVVTSVPSSTSPPPPPPAATATATAAAAPVTPAGKLESRKLRR